MIARRLDFYIARRFSTAIALILAAVGIIIFLADYVEVLRRFSDDDAYTAALGLKLALLRIPLLLDAVLPFAFLFAAILSLISLSRTLELVVARASGVSVWGFLRAPFAVAFLFGALATALFNPLAIDLKDQAERIEAELSDRRASRQLGHWFRQDGPAGPSIVHAASVSADGGELLRVTAFVFDPSGAFREKVTASRAVHSGDHWDLAGAEVVSASQAPRQVERYVLPTALRGEELKRRIVPAEAASIWSLPSLILTAQKTGLDTDRFRVTFHALVNRPLFLMAMVTIAATVSLRLSRYGGVWRLVLAGAVIGFLLYVLTEIAGDLGSNGIINPVLAAWLPPVAALTFGATVLLHQEDG